MRRTIQLKEDDAGAHNNLGKLLVDEGKFGEASSCFQRAIELLPADDSQRGVVQRNISLCRRLMELDDKLPAVLSGEVQAKAPEKVRFATLCKYKGRYATAARLYHEAFAEQPALADALPTGIRYNAARAAALAAAGKGEDADKLDDTERARLRRQALGWLRDDLAAWSKLLDGGPPQARRPCSRRFRTGKRMPTWPACATPWTSCPRTNGRTGRSCGPTWMRC